MGFVDVCCAVSDIPLVAQHAAAWLVFDDDQSPVTIPIRGMYDRLGGIEALITLRPQPALDALHELYLGWTEQGRLMLKDRRGRGLEAALRTEYAHRLADYHHPISLLLFALGQAQADQQPVWFDDRRVSLLYVGSSFATAAAREQQLLEPDLGIGLVAESTDTLIVRALAAAAAPDHARVLRENDRASLLELIRMTRYFSGHAPIKRVDQITSDAALALIDERRQAKQSVYMLSALGEAYAQIANRHPPWHRRDTCEEPSSRFEAFVRLGRIAELDAVVRTADWSERRNALLWAIEHASDELFERTAKVVDSRDVEHVLSKMAVMQDERIVARRDLLVKLVAPVPAAPLPPMMPSYAIGSRVAHAKFGEGTVVAVARGKTDKLTIDFASGRKVLAANFVQPKAPAS